MSQPVGDFGFLIAFAGYRIGLRIPLRHGDEVVARFHGYNKKGNVQNVYGNEACPSGKKNPDWIVGNDSKQDGSVWAESLGLLLSLDEMKSGAVTVPSSGQECASFTEALNAGAEIYASTPAETLPAKPETAVRKWVDSDSYPVLE